MRPVLLLMLALGGCATAPTSPLGQINNLATPDLATALKISMRLGNTNDEGCWTLLAGVVSDVQAEPQIGAATAYELTRMVVASPVYASTCGAIGLMPGATASGPIPLGALISGAVTR